MATASYVFQVGANHPPDDTRAEPGDIAHDLSASTITALLDAGALMVVPHGLDPAAVSALVSGLYKALSAEPDPDRRTIQARVAEMLPGALADLAATPVTHATTSAARPANPEPAAKPKKGATA